MDRLKLNLLGPPSVELNGEVIDIKRRKALALIIYLVMTETAHTRDFLATMFWPDYDQTNARANLRRTLSVINTILTGQWLTISREKVGLNDTPALWVDVKQFQAQVAQHHDRSENGLGDAGQLVLLAQAVALYRSDFLNGFTLRDSPDFDEWQFFQTETLRQTLATALQTLSHGYMAQPDYPTALSYARRWLALDLLHEPAHRCVMRLYALSHQRAAALRQYQECVRIFQEETGVEPTAETTALYEQIRTGSLAEPTLNNSVARPTPTIQAARPRLVDPPAPTFVAREQELEMLGAALERTLSGCGQPMFIVGDSGSGKTALASAFARQAQTAQADLLVALGSCNAHVGLGDPYLPFREILTMLTGGMESKLTPAILTAKNSQRLQELLPTTLQTISEIGPTLVDTLIPAQNMATRINPVPTSRPMTNGDGGQAHLFEQVTQVLISLSQRQPLLLIIDDAQWADVASLNLLFHLGRQLCDSNILLLTTYRPDEIAFRHNGERHPLESVVNELRRVYGDIQIDLSQTLTSQFVEAFIDSRPNQLSSHFRQALYAKTHGHPLFTIELLRALESRGNLVQNEQQQWVESSPLDWGALPAKVEAVIEERVGRLGDELREILTTASVAGELFTAQLLAKVLNISERELLRSLSQQLDKRYQLVRERCEEQVGEQQLFYYCFNHVLFQQHLYKQLGAGERRLLHRDIATALEELYASQIDCITAELAHHYNQAGQLDQAIIYLIKAGDQARDVFAQQEAAEFYEKALQFLQKQGNNQQAAQLLIKLGLSYHLMFNFNQARQAYNEGFNLQQRLGPTQPTTTRPTAPHALRIAYKTVPTTLDSNLAGDDESAQIIKQLFCGLVSLNANDDIVPEIAYRWEMLENGAKYIFHLRSDIYWSDGQPLTAEDFVYSWQRTINPQTNSMIASYLFDIKGTAAVNSGQLEATCLGVCAPDEHTLVVELQNPTSYFPQILATCMLGPIPYHVVQQHGEAWSLPENIVTYGPFKIVDWQPDRCLRLARNPDYRGQFQGNLEEIELNLNVSHDRLIQMYDEDQLDFIHLSMSHSQAAAAIQQHSDEHWSTSACHVGYVNFSLTPPFDDQRVRQAFAMAIDKDSLANLSLASEHLPAHGGLVPPEMPGHSPDIGLPYNPDQARALLAQAGYPSGQSFPRVEGLIKQGREVEATYLQKQWREVLGVEAVWHQLAWKDLLEVLSKNPKHFFSMGWSADYPDPDNVLRLLCQSRQNIWARPLYLDIINQARQTTKPDERVKLYQQADKILMEDAVIVPTLYKRHHILIKPWLRKTPMSAWNWRVIKDIVIEPH